MQTFLAAFLFNFASANMHRKYNFFMDMSCLNNCLSFFMLVKSRGVYYVQNVFKLGSCLSFLSHYLCFPFHLLEIAVHIRYMSIALSSVNSFK